MTYNGLGSTKPLALDAREYDIEVIEKTNETAARVFPIKLDVNNPQFYGRLDRCVAQQREAAGN